MSTAARKPVWVWLDGATEPALAGHFEQAGTARIVGRFIYSESYAAMEGAYALDPLQLPLARNRAGRSFETRLNRGLFGVFRDVCPEGYGRDLLNFRHGGAGSRLTDLELLEYARGDGVGAVEICEDIQAKQEHAAPPLAAVMEALLDLEPQRHASHAVHQLLGMGTSMGGERPKLTVQADDALWLAKLQDRGDTPHMPAREAVAMQLARDCGVDAAEVRLLRTDNGHETVLVRRFDREGLHGLRHAYLSAHTLLGLDLGSLPGDRLRSYLVLGDRARRLGVPARDIAELWRRAAFNALINNIDDHPRNHGFIRLDGQWRLAPAFDLVPLLQPLPEDGPVLAMAINASGQSQAGVLPLLQSAPHFGLAASAAAQWLLQSAQLIHANWQERMLAAGVGASFCAERQARAFQFAQSLAHMPDTIDQALDAISVKKRRS
mgnify:CR=1 FL=1